MRFAGYLRLLTLASALLAGCSSGSGSSTSTTTGTGGSGSGSTTGGGGMAITITNFAFSPLQLTVPAGASINVTNTDTQPHSVTSEASKGAYTPGAVAGVSFDTSVLGTNASGTITIPSTAPSGTVIPYYCTVHKAMMATPDGQITVQ